MFRANVWGLHELCLAQIIGFIFDLHVKMADVLMSHSGKKMIITQVIMKHFSLWTRLFIGLKVILLKCNTLCMSLD